MKARIIQGIVLIILFIIAVALFSNRSSAPDEISNEGYVPPSP